MIKKGDVHLEATWEGDLSGALPTIDAESAVERAVCRVSGDETGAQQLDEKSRALCESLNSALGKLTFEAATRQLGSPTLVDVWGEKLLGVWEKESGSLLLEFELESRTLERFRLEAPMELPFAGVPFCLAFGRTLLLAGESRKPELREQCRGMASRLGSLRLDDATSLYGPPTIVGRSAAGKAPIYASWLAEDDKRWLAMGLDAATGTLRWFCYRDVSAPDTPKGRSYISPITLEPGEQLFLEMALPQQE